MKERRGCHVPEEGEVGANVLGDEQVLWEHVAMIIRKFPPKMARHQTANTGHWKFQIPDFLDPFTGPSLVLI